MQVRETANTAFHEEKKSRPGGTRTPDQGIMLTSYGFRRPFRVCGLDCLFSLRVRRTVSTPFRLRAMLTTADLARD